MMDARALVDFKKTAVVLDIVWLFGTILSLYLFGYLTTYVDVTPDLASKAMIGMMFLVSGTLFMVAVCGVQADTFIDVKEFLSGTQYVFLCVLGVALLNLATLETTRIFEGSVMATPINRKMFVMLMGISETVFFQGFLQTVIYEITRGNAFFSVLGTSVIAGVYHAAVYGLSDSLIFFVIGGFIILCLAYHFSGNRISVPMVAHVIVNFLAGG